MDLKKLIRTIPDYPKPGIMFRDITTLLKDPAGLRYCIQQMHERYKKVELDYIVGIEARGFILGAALAHSLGIGFVPIRKKGKLPGKTIQQEYSLEYGEDIIEVHDDALHPGAKIVICDDLLATGGTALGALKLTEKLQAEIHEFCFVVDLPDLQGSKVIKEAGHSLFTLCEFEGE